MPERNAAEAGFTLVEILAALAITALAVGMLLQAVGGASSKLGLAAERSRAVTLANRLIEERMAARPGTALPRQGTANGLDWRLAIETLATQDQWRLARVRADVGRDGKTLASVETARLMTNGDATP